MNKYLPFILLLFFSLTTTIPVLALPSFAASVPVAVQENNFYNTASGLLKKYVKNGLVNYKELQKDKATLDRLVQQIGSYDLNKASKSEKKAFYLNAYNLLVLQQVLAHYPLKSVMDVNGFFDKQQFKVAGERLTLNELEKKKLLIPYNDARIHFALVCAASSCPPLLNEAYTPQQVELQLQQQARQTLRNPHFIRINQREKTVLISEIFKWYEPDFLAEAPAVTAYINKFRSTPLPENYKVSYYTYDWSLNDSN
ncbi:DUF547 domain-containing protein [Pontibacter sp. MBLB2868]|uniref:DUF547 domain-containing protein n=1 Tax=Pontibacter sp. MBLB2868 TaxID=3451555 RepID=UPI003F757131